MDWFGRVAIIFSPDYAQQKDEEVLGKTDKEMSREIAWLLVEKYGHERPMEILTEIARAKSSLYKIPGQNQLFREEIIRAVDEIREFFLRPPLRSSKTQ